MMSQLPSGVLGLVFAALVAAVMASLASKINSIATIFTLDFYTKFRPHTSERQTVVTGRLAACVAVVIGVLSAKPLLGSFDQAFQYIQDFTGYFTPGITVIFLLGLFWRRANETGALVAAISSVVLSIAIKLFMPAMPFMNRVGWVFVFAMLLAIVVSLITAAPKDSDTIRTDDVSFRTSMTFNIGAAIVVLILIGLYAWLW
jgi:SSS family solute:Na+ symporter